MNKTINESLVLIKNARERINDLKDIRSQVYKKERFYMADAMEKVIEPQFDVAEVDSKVVTLQRFILDLEQKVKVSNSTTKIEFEGDLAELFSSIKSINK